MKNFAIMILLFSCAFSNAQGDNDSTVTKDSWSFKTAEKRLKFSPLEVFSIIPTFGADLEVKMTDEIRLQTGAAYIIPGFQYIAGSSDGVFDKMGGYKLRAESRFHVFRKPNRYFSTELSFRHLIIRDEVGIGMEPSTQADEWGWEETNYAYFINTDMLFHRFNTRIEFKYGFEKTWENGFCFDMYTGISIRRTNVQSNSKIPEGGTNPGAWNEMQWTLEDNFTRGYATPIIGFKMGFILK